MYYHQRIKDKAHGSPFEMMSARYIIWEERVEIYLFSEEIESSIVGRIFESFSLRSVYSF